jgi:hypothetical protein
VIWAGTSRNAGPGGRDLERSRGQPEIGRPSGEVLIRARLAGPVGRLKSGRWDQVMDLPRPLAFL